MADETALGLSIGATNLAALTAGQAITRKAVLTLYPDRQPEVGVPSENPRLDRPGLVISDFVNRVGDERGVVASDGSVHRGEALTADAMRALAYAATGGRALPERVAVTYPAHWESAAVDALGGALTDVPEWSGRARPLLLIPDAAATLLAVRTSPGIPPSGTVAVCDFGGTGTSITLMDAAGDYHALAPTVRHRQFSGQLIDQALLSAVVSNLPSTGSFEAAGTAAIGSLSRLRAGCRVAKEQLSWGTMTTLADGLTGEIQVSRQELDDAIRASLDGFVTALGEAVAYNGIRDLVAVVCTGGGAHIPAITTALSRHLQVPVITTPRPQLTAAVGAALRAASGPGETAVTASAPAVPATVAAAPVAPATEPRPDAAATAAAPSAKSAWRRKPAVAWSEDGTDAVAEPKRKRWYRRPAVALIGAAAAVLVVGGAVAVGLVSANKSATAPAPAARPTPAAPPSAAPQATAQPAPAPQEAPPPSVSDTNPPATTEPPTTSAPPATPQAAPKRPVLPKAPTVPDLPPIPGLDEPIPGLDQVNEILQQFGVGPINQYVPH